MAGRKRGNIKLRETLRRREAEPTFWGDLDVETGDCGLMLLAEEPADRDEREGVLETAPIQRRAPLSLSFDDTA